ncbi:DUF6221 family protein [Streptomyces sp. sk226]|uniref:DUF6221 family protein n=1 Tax=Streptomyces sp. sk226 TaxID=2034268 RepID=UPI0011862227|nr:DUF6221 family protein [Streptomyces sp. sk226]
MEPRDSKEAEVVTKPPIDWVERTGSFVAGLITFLEARLAERRAQAHNLPSAAAQIAVAEVDAVHSILEDVIPKAYDREYGAGFDDAAMVAGDVLARLAAAYESHPDYQEGWRP